jgi:hypothetical protein
MDDSTSRGQLTELRHGLLRLHKTLLDWERGTYEQVHGRQSGGELLKLLLDDPHFAWLRPMSQTIVRIDEMLDADTPPTTLEINEVFATVNEMTAASDGSEGPGQRYGEALQNSPEVVLAHRDVREKLVARARPGERVKPAEQ